MRREKLLGLVAVALALLAAIAVGCGSDDDDDDGGGGGDGNAQSGGSLVVANWGGTDNDARRTQFYPSFQDEFGVKLTDVPGPMDYGKVRAMVDAGKPQWDIATTAPSLFYTLGPKYFEPIDYDRNPEVWKNVINQTKYAAPEHLGCEAILYKKSSFPDGGPQNWQDFWDTEKFPGKRALGADGGVPWFTLEAASMAAGAAPDAVYPIDWDAAFASLDKLRDSGDLEIWSSYAEGAQMMAGGQVDIIRLPPTAAWELVSSGEWVISWTNAICWTESLHIIKGANAAAAQDYAEWIVDPQRQAAYAEESHSGPVNTDAFEFISEDVRDLLPVPPEQRDSVVWQDYDWYGTNYDELVKRWDQWRLDS